MKLPNIIAIQFTLFIFIIGTGFSVKAFDADRIKTILAEQLEKAKANRKCYSGEMTFKEKTCKYSGDSCFTYITGSKVIKGCKKEYLIDNELGEKFFESMSKKFFESCDTELCNSQNVQQIECFDCESKKGLNSKCVTGKDLKPKKCLLEMQPTVCYHYINEALEIVKRGCMSELNDKNLQKECNEIGEKCKKCKDSECNARSAFQKCLTCDIGSTACDSVQCKDYSDKCYVHVNPFGVQRGCLGAAEIDHPNNGKEIVQDCSKDDSTCKLCSGAPNCNSETAVEEHCIVCDSKTDPKCVANSLKNSMSKKCPATLKAFGCFTSLNDDGQIVRGCMKSLSNEKQKECSAGSKTCKSCFGDNCNEKENFFTCHSCDSTKDPNCFTNPDIQNSLTCENSKKCYTTILNGVVKRGCVGDKFVPHSDKCTGPLCDTCNDKANCNSKPVVVEKCFECDSTDKDCTPDSEKFPSKSTQCNLELIKKGCYHHIDEKTKKVKRGCVNKIVPQTVEHKECVLDSAGKSTCKICQDADNCNARKTFSTCISCKYPEDPKCNANPTKSQTCKSYVDQCFTAIENKNVIRGCLAESEHQKKCLDGDEMCEVCDPSKEENCNKKPLELEQCIECDSENEKECQSQPNKFGGQVCNGPKKPKHEGCFVSIVGDHYKRGCISKLPQDEKDKCLDQSSTCKSFHGSNSNDVTSFQQCYKCNSHDDPNCLNKVPPHTATEICELTTSSCTTGVDKYGITHRRCSKDKSAEENFFKYHETCDGAKCNSKIFPTNRQQCYQCNGDSDCDLSDEKHKKENAPCNVYSELDKCYTYQDKDNKIYRGCLSDSTNSRMLCESNPSKCIKCSDPGCNKQPKKDLEFYPKDRLQCYQCSGDSDCDFTDGKIKKEKVPCESSSKFDQCFSYMDSDKKMHRGCLTDRSDSPLRCVSDPSKCAKCKASGCNNQPKFRKVAFSCIHCDDDKDCGYEQDKTKSKACPAEILPYYMKDACFARTFTNIKSDKKTFKRGCTNLNEATEVSIPDGMCFESNCNKNKIKAEQCQKCSSKIGGDCSVVKGKNISAKCDGDYPYGKRGCFTLVKDDKVERGCVKDLKDRHDECLKNPGACAICETDDCNNEDRNKIERNFGHRVTSTILLNIFAVFVLFLYY